MTSHIWPPDVRKLGDRLAVLTVARAVELGYYLETVHGVQAARSSLPVVLPNTEPDPKTRSTEPTEFDVLVDGFDAIRRLALIRAVRELTGLGLKEALDQVKAFPGVVKKRLPRQEAERLKAHLEAAGAEVSLHAHAA